VGKTDHSIETVRAMSD